MIQLLVLSVQETETVGAEINGMLSIFLPTLCKEVSQRLR